MSRSVALVVGPKDDEKTIVRMETFGPSGGLRITFKVSYDFKTVVDKCSKVSPENL
jgi:hypothetical protein